MPHDGLMTVAEAGIPAMLILKNVDNFMALHATTHTNSYSKNPLQPPQLPTNL